MPPVGERTIAFIEELYDGRNCYPVRLNADSTAAGYLRLVRRRAVQSTKSFVVSSDMRRVV